jgi:hypothetical protein
MTIKELGAFLSTTDTTNEARYYTIKSCVSQILDIPIESLRVHKLSTDDEDIFDITYKYRKPNFWVDVSLITMCVRTHGDRGFMNKNVLAFYHRDKAFFNRIVRDAINTKKENEKMKRENKKRY